MTAKKARKKSKRRVKEEVPRKNHNLRRAEAEIMFLIWKSRTSLTYAQITAQYPMLFGAKKEEVTIRGVIHDIKCLERATKRRYLQPSEGSRGEYAINRDGVVDLQWTAVILLELDKGYEHIENQINRGLFEEYLFRKYKTTRGFTRSFISGRVDYFLRTQYISFDELEPRSQHIIVENRLKHEIEYLKLIVQDYYQVLQRQSPDAPIVPHLKELLKLYGSDKLSANAH